MAVYITHKRPESCFFLLLFFVVGWLAVWLVVVSGCWLLTWQQCRSCGRLTHP